MGPEAERMNEGELVKAKARRCTSAPLLVEELVAKLEAERQSRVSLEETLKEEVEKERVARLEAESAYSKSSMIVSILSPMERLSLSVVARVMHRVRCPRPRCFCCGGPCFWFVLVPLFLTRVAWPRVEVLPEEKPRTTTERPAHQFTSRERPFHPVLVLPGMTSTALEVWRGVGCYEDATRERVWSSTGSTATFLLDPECLQRHLAMNGSTWDDPDMIRVRASTGLSAADAFGPLNLWGELLANLAILGYDEASIALMGYDWRLDARRLEKRDGYLTRLRRVVETLVETNDGMRVVMLAHSLGANHALYFFAWVESKDPGWVERNVESLVTIGGAFLGAPKCLSYIVSGEMTDALNMGQFFSQLSELHGGIGRDALLALTRSWGSVPALLPKGHDALWDEPNASLFEVDQPLSASETIAFLRRLAPDYMANVDDEYALFADNADGSRAWTNPLLTPLPPAASTKLYCLYGVGRPTPRNLRFVPLDEPSGDRLFEVDRKRGVTMGEGDGTVPLVSLGYMCVDGWNSRRLNPHRMRVITKEYRHEDLTPREAMTRPLELIQGLANDRDADHITILGNKALITDILDIVTAHPTLTRSYVVSGVCDLARNVSLLNDTLRDGALDACTESDDGEARDHAIVDVLPDGSTSRSARKEARQHTTHHQRS